MNVHYKKQQGMALWKLIVLLTLTGTGILIGIKSVPVYLTNYEIHEALEWAAHQPHLHDASENEIHDALARRFNVGYINIIDSEDVKIKRVDKGRRLSVSYHKNIWLFNNLYLHFKFDNKVLMPTRVN